MAYTPITNAEIQVKQPVRQELMQKIKDNFDDHEGRLAAAAGGGAGGGVPNGSFEIDSDNDGIPDGWTRSLYPGGSGEFETANPDHGAKAYRFTHPGGAGNGGGYLESGYVEITEAISPLVGFSLRCSVAGMKNIVRLNYYTAAKVFISSEDIYSSTANPTVWTRYGLSSWWFGIPPANARYVKIQLISGFTDTNVSGTIYWDNVTLNADPNRILVPFTMAEVRRIGSGFVDVASVTIRVPKGFSALVFPASLRNVAAGSPNGSMRFRISSIYSNTIFARSVGSGVDGYSNNDGTIQISVAGISGNQLLYMQLSEDGDGDTHGKKEPSFAEFVRF